MPAWSRMSATCWCAPSGRRSLAAAQTLHDRGFADVADQLEMTNPRRPRFVYVISDGGWADTPSRR